MTSHLMTSSSIRLNQPSPSHLYSHRMQLTHHYRYHVTILKHTYEYRLCKISSQKWSTIFSTGLSMDANPRTFAKGEFREISKFSLFKLNFQFWGKNHKNSNQGTFSYFYEFTLYMIFQNFHEKSHHANVNFQENRKNHI